MKKSLALLMVGLVLMTFFSDGLSFATETMRISQERGYVIPEAFTPKGGSIIASSATGQVLWSEDGDQLWVPYSISKMMSVYLFYRAMDQGKFSLDTEVTIGKDIQIFSTYYEISNNKMKEGAVYTVSDLIDLSVLASSSAAVMALIKEMGLSHGQFVDLMNETANELGMTQSKFYNAVGAPNSVMANFPAEGYSLEEHNTMSAEDIAVLLAHLNHEYPEITEHTKLLKKTFLPDTEYEETFETLLEVLEGARYGVPGVDGMKTGSGGTYGYNLSVSAERDGLRIVGAVLGIGDWYDYDFPEYRSWLSGSLVEHTFKNYEYRLILPKGEHQVGDRTLITKEDLYDVVPKGQEPSVKMVGNTFETNLDNRVYLKGFKAPSVSFIDPVEVAKAEAEATRARRRSPKNMISPVAVSLMFASFWLWGQLDARRN